MTSSCPIVPPEPPSAVSTCAWPLPSWGPGVMLLLMHGCTCRCSAVPCSHGVGTGHQHHPSALPSPGYGSWSSVLGSLPASCSNCGALAVSPEPSPPWGRDQPCCRTGCRDGCPELTVPIPPMHLLERCQTPTADLCPRGCILAAPNSSCLHCPLCTLCQVQTGTAAASGSGKCTYSTTPCARSREPH